MIDIHCHLLPGIDDGAGNMDQALALARLAVADGITHMVVTPHIQPGTYNNNRHSIERVFEGFKAAVAEQGIALHLAMAAEVRICPEILPMIADGSIPLFIAPDGRKTLLLEFPHSHIPPGSDKMIYWLRGKGVRCLIAHPERNKELMRNIDKLQPFLNMGCKLQVTAASVAGRFGEPPRVAAMKLLERGWVDLLATDAHNASHRPPELKAGSLAAAAEIGVDAAGAMVTTGPWAIVGGMFEVPAQS
ncbi:capsular biosynthesis protein [Mariprofundus erugo]|uniref:tyrosine-protein phosphatase n=1 Tax=Mariprofundus erugo TaxID=2528639 RepID=UPI0010FD7F05|nr:CpsB/CapC family capsule biosynthesis tyrosine phosphatase [Mariprofundus erugo]TLS78387.1 capsular biosynthesis protein [Mariprofundus erugo]